MSSPSKNKGNSYEREIVNLAKSWGFADSERAYGSNGRAMGEHEEVDVKIVGNNVTVTVQCKRRKKIASFLKCEHSDVVMFREDRGDTSVLMPIDFFLTLLKRLSG